MSWMRASPDPRAPYYNTFTMMLRFKLLLLLIGLLPWSGGCAPGPAPHTPAPEPPSAEPSPTAGLPRAPWSEPALSAAAVPAVYRATWERAENRDRCAFGVAGTGASAAGPSYDAWPHERTWADGSSAGYGPEGGTGPNQLAYLRVQGQECLYNVWSRLGTEHLEHLLGQLRFVSPHPEP